MDPPTGLTFTGLILSSRTLYAACDAKASTRAHNENTRISGKKKQGKRALDNTRTINLVKVNVLICQSACVLQGFRDRKRRSDTHHINLDTGHPNRDKLAQDR
jgi:hypothetical protein